MSGTLLEQARSAHEEIERLERLVVNELQKEVKTHKETLHQNHRVKHMVDSILAAEARLVEIYEDKDGARKEEIDALAGERADSGTNNVFGSFYDRLKEIKDYHRRHPHSQVLDPEFVLEEMLKEEPVIEFSGFSGEEGYGRYLDVHELFHRFLNAKFGKRIEYSAYLDEFPFSEKIPRAQKHSKQYQEYMEVLLYYLVSFFERTQPLKDVGKMFSKVESEFEEQWAAGKVKGWEDTNTKKVGSIDLDDYDSAEQLAELGGDKLKDALAALGLKSGGTVQQRAQRLFLTKFTPLEKLDKKLFATEKPEYRLKDIALLETKVSRLCELLNDVIEETKAHVEKKQALRYEEMEVEREEEDMQPESESDDDEQQVYNPLKLPMGWDGKPIPYWLYKLHGLGQEFKCEICGNSSYWGRRAFERHFKEFRHQHGMRCLGIPNTKNFHEVTSIKDARALWEKIQEKQGVNKWRPDLEEEYEDKEGNVYNKKTYTDLQRQGLI